MLLIFLKEIIRLFLINILLLFFNTHISPTPSRVPGYPREVEPKISSETTLVLNYITSYEKPRVL